MIPEEENKQNERMSQAEVHELMGEKMRAAVRLTLMAVLEAELEEYIGAGRYERKSSRRDHRIGTRTRNLETHYGVIEDLAVPRTRGGFQTELFEKYQRRQRELDQAIGGMFVKGLSTEQVGAVMEKLSDKKPSPSTVSRVFHKLEGEYETWKQRDLPSRYVYVFADGTYFSVIYGEEGQKMPVLALIGITPESLFAKSGWQVLTVLMRWILVAVSFSLRDIYRLTAARAKFSPVVTHIGAQAEACGYPVCH
jgi:transposase-like protein